MSNLGSRMKEIRAARSMTQEDLAARANVTHSTISRLENHNDIGLDKLRDLAAAMKLTRTEWLSVLRDWIEETIGSDDFTRLHISASHILQDAPLPLEHELALAIQQLTAAQKQIVLDTCKRPNLFPVIEELHRLYNRLARP
jgi:transcriptional regulator with XRE-family HTH domain